MRIRVASRRRVALAVVALVAAACASDEGGLVLDPPDRQSEEASPAGPRSGGRQDRNRTPTGESVDLSRTRDDVDCSAVGLGEDDIVDFMVAHVVVGGVLGEVCFGELDATLVDAWNLLAAIAPRGQLADLGVFGGFDAEVTADETLLAFVNTLDDDGVEFQMSINLDAAQDDPDELVLTMAHEFSHVFTATSTQLDRSLEAIDGCDTYFNGEGCFLDDSLMFAWVESFWGDTVDELDVGVEPSVVDGIERCDADGGFFGTYAASNPEEDFAESFSAYVLRVEPSPDQQARVDFMAAQPGLVEFRERAIEAGLGPVAGNFDQCGPGA
ncbi:MAG TPA: hypothetical protein VMW08_18080 [Acidimicrobiales bacterium]|nr:hypothetical protein [Acidimicrobiales bacterium]